MSSANAELITKPIGLRGGINRYAYVGGNPVNFMDPSGVVAVPTTFWLGMSNTTGYRTCNIPTKKVRFVIQETYIPGTYCVITAFPER